MQFSDTSNLQGILQDVYFLSDTNSTSYATNDIVRNVNRWVYRAVTWVLEANQDWEFDDRNFTTHPIVTTTLVADQKDYELPTDLLKLNKVFVKNANGDYATMIPISESDFSGDLDEVFPTSGMPSYYDVRGASLFLYPAPAAASVTTAQGLKLSITREFDAFSSTDTTQETSLAEPFDRIASLGASYDYLLVNGPMDKAQTLRAEIETIKRDMTRFYKSRDKGRKTSMVPSSLANRDRNIL